MSESHGSNQTENVDVNSELGKRAQAAEASMGSAFMAGIALAVISTLMLIATKLF